MEVGRKLTRVDAVDKVTGRAYYTDDMGERPMLVAKVLHSTIANGFVKKIDVSAAAALDGVVKVVTCFDVPQIPYPTPGHPWSVEASHQDVCDRLMLTRRVRYYGDDIAAVVAEDEIIAQRALKRIRVEYEELPPLLTPEAAMTPGVTPIHQECPDNVLKHTVTNLPPKDCPEFSTVEEVLASPKFHRFEGHYDTQQVQHCHIENPISYAYMEHGRITVVSSTQIPHIVRRVVGQALGIPWGQVRVIKPYIGGGFGNKQEVLYEPLNAYLTTQVGGRAVKLELTREETFQNTRSRHPEHFDVEAAVDDDMRLMARSCRAVSNQGSYASHGHAIVANSVNGFRQIYADVLGHKSEAYTVYTNLPAPGAMRAYGIPQGAWAAECLMEDIAHAMGWDPYTFRLKNLMPEGYVDPTNGITCHSSGLKACMEKGAAFIGWDELRRAYQNQTGPIRRGVGMSVFVYKTGVWPISLETASARIVLNQDGTVQLSVGATEIGQGGDTVFCQMAAEAIGIPTEDVHIVSFQDTDITPFDTGAYASRQTYVTGMAIKKVGLQFRQKLLDYAAEVLDRPAEGLTIQNRAVCDASTGEVLRTLEEISQEAFYSFRRSVHITAEDTNQCKDNTFAFGCCFAQVEVDIPVGKVKILHLVNVHDSGKLINPALAEAQVHGGMSMGIGQALSEEMKFDSRGRLLNGNLLDYKMPTAMDHPELHALFVETDDPTGPFGNKALGEPPAIPVAPAIRAAILNATGVALNRLPMSPQYLVEQFTAAGLIGEGGKDHV
ncbi:xanthine dehydrogenase molybdenum-binding subunit XdhA [Pseudoflavonifractor phocaeensis]|uniref:xanthine dehydrogenase subunit XdhA n=1 Tax=Pseudoflavonifractor phocaeensis TaxID=1870988 RepID=UPI0019591494|nr:xanthine dehydrogenase subunit XdhA [Pseudoflavonifractor phocaeensis]MBM6937606.1 xanthine dehydrogenase molybdenum-binding subunit XdhA [Pseudoflavonifractor phocaeensis]